MCALWYVGCAIISQCRTAVLHCCKGDAASQLEMAISGCQNSVTPEMIDYKFVTRDYVSLCESRRVCVCKDDSSKRS